MDSYNNYLCSGASKKELIDRTKIYHANKDGHVDLPEYAECVTQVMGWCEISMDVKANTFTYYGCFKNEKVNQDQFKKCINKLGG
jgi:hypothetical protein